MFCRLLVLALSMRGAEAVHGSCFTRMRHFVLMLPIVFLADIPGLDALDRVVAIASPVLSTFGWTLEARGTSWAHWMVGGPLGTGSVIRAYAFDSSDERGVAISATGPYEIPAGVRQKLYGRIVEVTAWTLKDA